jgi:O-antigen/teichoic acid export membrane protein
LANLKNNGLLHNLSWMLCSEMVAKISRIATVIVMAAYLNLIDYGLVTLAIALHELMRIFSRAGAGSKVIQCEEHELPRFASNASLLQWIVCLFLCSIQILSAPAIAAFYQLPQLSGLLTLMALSYIFYPMVSSKVFMLQRLNRMRYFGLASAVVLIIDNLAIVLFLVLGHGVLAVAYAKIISAFAWVTLFLWADCTRFRPKFHASTFKYLARYSVQIFTTDLLRMLRNQVDVLIAARLLPAEYFGLYSFAKNAGVGLAQSLINAFMSALYPYICKQLRQQPLQPVAKQSLKFAALTAIIFIIQAACALFYVQILFDVQWHSAGWLVSVLCLSSVSAIFIDTRGFFYRAQNNVISESKLMFFAVSCTALSIFIISPQTPMALALTTTLSSTLWLTCLVPFFYKNLIQPKSTPINDHHNEAIL